MSYSTAKRYARALFALAAQKKEVEAAAKDVRTLRHLLETSEDLNRFFDNPVIQTEKRRHILREIFQGKLSDAVYQFLLFVESKRRLGILKPICEVFEQLYMASRNIVPVRVTTSVPLSAEQTKAMRTHLEKKFRSEISADLRVDPSLLGGVKVQKEDLIYDYSLRSQLERFKENIINA